MITDLHHFAIIASDEEKSLRFYKTLGFEIVSARERSSRNDKVILLECSGIILEMFIQENHPRRVTDPEAYGLRHIAFKCDAIEQMYEILKGYGPEDIRLDSISQVKMFFVKDPDGQPIEIHE